MVDKQREIYIKLEQIKEIISTLDNIKKKEEYIKKLFETYDNLNLDENKTFENWNNYLDDITQKIDHVAL